MNVSPLLSVTDLRLHLATAQGPVQALRGLSFTLERGQSLGLIGESGCGKSLTALALMGLLPEGARIEGQMQFDGRALHSLVEADWCRVRGKDIGMVFQEPMTALNPLHTIGQQIAEPMRLHLNYSAAQARAEALRLLERVQLPQAAQRLDAYPHQLSGGQRQRVVIAIALACKPKLLIADEPTTALDLTIQREVLLLIRQLVAEDQMALLLISHDLGLMAQHVQRLAVMYAGTLAEIGSTAEVFAQLAHPYTRGLMAARPRLGRPRVPGQAAPPLATIPGRVPELALMPSGCAFAPRCARAQADCTAAQPPLRARAGGHLVACLHPHEQAHEHLHERPTQALA
jgi:peptide/nickel transport system ATP-binding protein